MTSYQDLIEKIKSMGLNILIGKLEQLELKIYQKNFSSIDYYDLQIVRETIRILKIIGEIP